MGFYNANKAGKTFFTSLCLLSTSFLSTFSLSITSFYDFILFDNAVELVLSIALNGLAILVKSWKKR